MTGETRLTSSLDYNERVYQARAWYDAASCLVDGSNIPFAQEVLETLSPDNGCTVTEPIAVGEKWGLGRKSGPDSVSITPLDEQDTSIHPYFDKIYKNLQAHYFEGERSLYMRYGDMSGVMGSIVFLHEGLHAHAHKNNLWRNVPDGWSHWYEEAKAFEFESGLLQHAGGEDYMITVNKWTPIISERLRNGIGTDKGLMENLDVNKLAAAIDPQMSDIEMGFLKSAILIISGMFSFNGSTILPNDITKSARFVRWMYNELPSGIKTPTLLQDTQLS